MFLEFKKIQISITKNSANSDNIESFIKDLKHSIMQLINQGHENICFYCSNLKNDPLDFQNIFNIFDFCIKNGVKRIKIKTNGKNITEEVLKQLINKGVFFFEFTLFGHNSQIHDNYTRIKNSFTDIFNAVNIIEKIKIFDLSISAFIQLNIIIDSNNYQYLENMVQLALQYKVNLINLYIKNFNFAFSNIIPVIKKSIDTCLENQYTKCWMNIIDIPACLLKNYEYFINDFYCKTNDAEHEKIFIEKCQNCIIKNKCSGIAKKYIENFGQKEFTPIQDLKFTI